MNNWTLTLEYEINGEAYKLVSSNPQEIENHRPLHLKVNIDNQQISLQTDADTSYKITACKLEMHYPFHRQTTTYLNSFQSWTDSKEHFKNEREFGIHRLLLKGAKEKALDMYGGSHIYTIKRKKGRFHGYTYMYVRNNDQLELFGSLSDHEGFTIFDVEMKKEKITMTRDCLNVHFQGQYHLFNITRIKGIYNDVFDRYFNQMDIPKPTLNTMTGWTSWYNYYQGISEQIIHHNIDQFIQNDISIDIFQIDDGYQTYVGDWLDIHPEKFPNGMDFFPKRLHEKKIKAGIWLAPFVAERNSKLFQTHPEWFLRDSNNDFICAGANWSSFYPLDIYLPEVQDYLAHVFHVVINQWGYDMVKLDFLYAACLGTRSDKTRGQVMSDALDLLRKWVGKALILACGVPLGSAFGKVDFCRIGCDVGLDWDDRWITRHLHRERVSTKNTLANTLCRYHLTNRAFLNDPDVFFLRDDNIQLSVQERKLVAKINQLFGDVIFTSDDLATYTPWQQEILEETLQPSKQNIIDIKLVKKDFYQVDALDNKQPVTYYINLSTRSKKMNQYKIKAKSMIKIEV